MVILFFLSYALSTIISIYPRISFFGSYSRLQGLYTFLSYGVVFFALIHNLKERVQVERLFKAMIFVSIPISFYGILQHFQIDPIPWSTASGERIAGANLGNPIFVAAYLIMILPVTISWLIKSLLEKTSQRKTSPLSWIRSVIYGLIAVTQITCIIFTQSRGPWIGLFVSFFIFFLAALVFIARSNSESRPDIKDSLKAFLFALGGIATGFFPAYVYFLVKKKGYRWLWLGFIFQTIILSGLLFALNLPDTPLKPLLKIPYVSRLGELSYRAESGTTRVRVLIWEGTVNLIRSNPMRMFVGYGPESMKHVWDRHSPPELAQHESKSAAPDRAHNETFDRIVTTGLIGLFLYIALMAGIFYLSFKWVGLITARFHRHLFLTLIILGCVIGALLPKLALGSFAFSGIGLSFGFMFAIAIYLMTSPFMLKTLKENEEKLGDKFLIIGFLAGISAHFIEIQFGIAIATTRLYFFAFTALILILGMRTVVEKTADHQPAQETAPIKDSRFKKKKAHHVSKKQVDKKSSDRIMLTPLQRYLPLREVMTYALMTGLVISNIMFTFTSNARGEIDTFSIMWLSLAGQQQNFGPLIILVVTYLSGILLVLDVVWHSSLKTGRKGDFRLSIGTYTATVLAIFLIYSFLHASFVKPGIDLSGIVPFFFIYIFCLALIMTYFLMPKFKDLPQMFWQTKRLWIYPIFFLAAVWIIADTNIAPVKADIYLKLGQANERNYRWNEGVRLVTQAIETAPEEETFYLNLGRILFGKANSSNDFNEKNAIFEKIRETMERAHSLNSMNSDHIANLGLLYLRWAEFDPVPESRRQKLGLSNSYFQKAMEKSPKKIIIINNWARVFAAEGNFDEAIKKLNYSLSLDNTFAGTYIALGDIYRMYGRPKEALDAYEKAVKYDQHNSDAMSMLGLMYFNEGRLDESLELTRKATELQPDLMKAQSLLGLLYFKLGRFQEAIDANRKVLRMRPSDMGAHRNLVILYDKIGRRDYAIKHLESAIQYAPPQERQQLEQVLKYMKSGKSLAPQGS
jgi:tetratricopeptide (TPR) repeat protein/O-antigen ligase